jgi:hypothetical protein
MISAARNPLHIHALRACPRPSAIGTSAGGQVLKNVRSTGSGRPKLDLERAGPIALPDDERVEVPSDDVAMGASEPAIRDTLRPLNPARYGIPRRLRTCRT